MIEAEMFIARTGSDGFAVIIQSVKQDANWFAFSKRLRLTLARLLISERRYDESRKQFDRLILDNPDNPEVIYPVAMLALQQGDAKFEIFGKLLFKH